MADATPGADLVDDRRRVSGYVRDWSADDYTAEHFMVADIGGQDVVYENTLPIRFDGEVMPWRSSPRTSRPALTPANAAPG
ncbi:MAG: hypothetical protein IPL36_07310 [Nigerium sp.]|nr:hypothetical protein [Nigerium sp.]